MMALPRLSTVLALLMVSSPVLADTVTPDPTILDLKVTPGDNAALRAGADLHAQIQSIETGLTLAVETAPSVITDPLASAPSANASHETLGFKAAWSAAAKAKLDLAVDDSLIQTWTPLSLFSTANHQVNTDNQTARLGLTVGPLSALDLSLTGDAARAATRDMISDAASAPPPSFYTTETQGAAAGLKWRPTGWFTLDAKGRLETTDAEWRGVGAAGFVDARLDYQDFAPSVTGALALPWSDKLSLGLEHAISPVDPHAFSSFATVEDRAPDARFGPSREWRYRLTLDQTLLGAIKLNAAVVRAQIESATELGPVGTGLQAPVSVSGGQRQEMDLKLSTPLAAVGLSSITLEGSGAWRDSQIRDPFTGDPRRESAETPQVANLGVVQSLSADNRARWGLEGHFGGGQTLYQMSQITQVRVADSVGGFIEYQPGPFAVRLQVDGLYGGDRSSTDIAYAAPRGSIPDDPVERIDTHIASAQAIRLILRKSL